jgi:hypothetical protein
MSSSTPNLGLVLPGNGEDVGDWDEPLNTNFGIIDTQVGDIIAEIAAAASGVGTLSQFLAVSLDLTTGALLPVPEVAEAENTFLYGYLINGSSTPNYNLKQQLDAVGTELWGARGGAASLKAAGASSAFEFPNQLVSGLSGVISSSPVPTFAGSTGLNVHIDGSTTPLMMMISGYTARIRTLALATVPSTTGNGYLVCATQQPNGTVVVDGSGGTNGSTGADTLGNMTLFTDLTTNFTTQNVQVGDYITLINGNDAGTYLIQAIGGSLQSPGSNINQLQIVGNFPVGLQSAISYQIFDPLGVVLSVVAPAGAVPGAVPSNSLAIAEADVSGGTISAVRPRNYKNDFIGAWQAVSVAGPVIMPEVIYTHYLGTDKLDIAVQISQANDGSAPVEEIALGQVSNNLSVAITNALTLTLATLGQISPSSGTLTGAPSGSLANALATGSPPAANFEALSGSISAALSGTVIETRSLALKWDRNSVHVKGLVSGILYTDYTGTAQTAGYLRVVARRRGY